MEQVEDKPADGVDVRTFSEAFFGEQVHFYVLRLRKSFLVWAGYGASFQALAVAMSTRHSGAPTSTQLLGDAMNDASCTLARRLSQKTGCQVFVSLNIPDKSMHPAIEAYLLQTLKNEPKSFYL